MTAYFDRLGFRKFSQLYYLCIQLFVVMGGGAATPLLPPGRQPPDISIIILAVTGVVVMFYELFLLLALAHYIPREKGWKKVLAAAMMLLPLWVLFNVAKINFWPLIKL